MRTYGDLLGAYGDLWGVLGTFGYLEGPMGTYGGDLLRFPQLHMSFFLFFSSVFVTTMFLIFQGSSPLINGFSIVSRPPFFPLGFVFSIRGEGGDLI